MAKPLNELSGELKEFILNLQSSEKSSSNRPDKYNNLKLSMNLHSEKNPHVIISVGISEVTYNLNTLDKISGSLGQEERYIQRWFSKSSVIPDLQAAFKLRLDNVGKITDVE